MIYVLAAALFVFLCGAKFVKSGEFTIPIICQKIRPAP